MDKQVFSLVPSFLILSSFLYKKSQFLYDAITTNYKSRALTMPQVDEKLLDDLLQKQRGDESEEVLLKYVL